MKELPILFKPEMIRATLREIDPKEQTRRVINKLRKFGKITEFGRSDTLGYDWHFRDKGMRWNDINLARLLELCPYGQPGDRLWVRETFWCINDSDNPSGYQTIDCGSTLALGEEYASIDYCIDGEFTNPPTPTGSETVARPSGRAAPGNWWLSPPGNWDGERDYHGEGEWVFLPWVLYTKHSSIHMPRWASRILLEITGVRVERLQDISEEDAIAEGCEAIQGCEWRTFVEADAGVPYHAHTAIDAYRGLWESINGEGSWDANPWVWVIEFRKIQEQT
ncbi:hypothetical protein SAMN05216428_101116 [Nitrosospira sp. Nsp11]|uniref:hypothetical protein n=1 Tax=Nitrosospira sp. Nsp11 TaxID=1855338 RepID=UPI00091B758D|nr:hypothetical protein [Nitrosospira sp. Nsp11]SHL11365.1 hypothetical protein SAMN05216428_101116 [Nitrosospira sp. Nsp11]